MFCMQSGHSLFNMDLANIVYVVFCKMQIFVY